MRFKIWLETDEDEEAEDLYRFMPDRLQSDEQRKKVAAYLQRKKEAETAQQWKQQDAEMNQQVTLDSPIGALWGKKRRCDMITSDLIAQMDWAGKPLKQIIRTTYDQIKKALWDVVAENFGYTHSIYRPLPPEGFDDMGDAEKRIAIHDRSMNYTINVVHDFYGCLQRQYRHYETTYQLPPLPDPVVKWIGYLWDELQHDDEIKKYHERQQVALRAQNERWAKMAEEEEKDAQIVAKALYAARNRLPYWSDATEAEALKTARDFMRAEPHERGQFSQAIRDIAAKALKRRIPSKSYYMEPKEATHFVQQAQQVNLDTTDVATVVDVLNKTIGITQNQNPDTPEWSDNVHPGLGAGILGPAGMLKMSAAEEIRKRIRKAKQAEDEQTIRDIYYALDAENRRLFFKK